LTVALFESGGREDDFTRFNYGRALLIAGHLDAAQSIFDALAERGVIEITTRAIRGVIAAMRGDTATALQELRWSESVDDERATFNCGLIAGALGETGRAIEFMRQAIAHGYQMTAWHTVRVELDPLRDHPQVQELLRPKG